MGQSFGYGSVTELGFVGFETKLHEGEWKTIDAEHVANASGVIAGDVGALLALPMLKRRALAAIDGLAKVLAGQSLGVEVDDAWDRAQTRLDAELALKATDDDANVAAAAQRARGALLAGKGTAQNNYEWKDEVSFGRTQVRLAATEPLASDVVLLGVKGTITRIGAATEALAKIVDAANAGERTASRSRMVRVAWTECVSSFNGVHDDLEWLRENTAPGKQRERIVRLLAPFERLLEDCRERSAPASSTAEPAKPVANPSKPTG